MKLNKKLLALSEQWSDLSKEIMKDPRTKNVIGFAIAAVIAVVGFSFAQNGGSPGCGPAQLSTSVIFAEETPTSKEVTLASGTTVNVVESHGKTRTIEYQGIKKEIPEGALVGYGTKVDTRIVAGPPVQVVTLAQEVIAPYHGIPGQKFYMLAEKENCIVARGTNSSEAFSLPKYIFKEFGGAEKLFYDAKGIPRLGRVAKDKKTITVSDKHGTPIYLWNGELPQGLAVESDVAESEKAAYPLQKNLQGGSPELLAELNKLVPPADKMDGMNQTSDANAAYGSAPFFSIFEEYLRTEKNLTPEQKAEQKQARWKLSVRPELEKYGIGTKEINKARPDFSCGILTMKSALELLWSEKEGRPVKLSSAFIRWAHDQVNGPSKGMGTDSSWNTVLMGIQKYGVCTEALMPEGERNPSQAALQDAANRKRLVVRTLGMAKRIAPDKGDGPQNTRCFPVMELIIQELQKKRPILVAGWALTPKDLKNPIVERQESSSARALGAGNTRPEALSGPYWYPNCKEIISHVHLLTGFYAFPDRGNNYSPKMLREGMDPATSYTYMFEFREPWPSYVGDKGFIYTPAYRISSLGDNRFYSLGLE